MYEIFLKLLEQKGVTAYKVGKETGIAASTFSDWKSGRSVPKQEKLQKIANYFGVTVDYLMTGKEPVQHYLNREDVNLLRSKIEKLGYTVYNNFSRNYGDSLVVLKEGCENLIAFRNNEILEFINDADSNTLKSTIENRFNEGPYYIPKNEDESIREAFYSPDVNDLAYKSTLTYRDEKDIKNILENTEQLLKQDGLMFDGEPASQEAIDSILSAMQIGMEMAKKKNKELYTPKKYKKEQ